MKKIPTIIAILILIIAVAAGVFFVQNQQIFRIGASPDAAPQDVRVTNIKDTSFTVSWTTDKKTPGSLVVGESANNITTPAVAIDTTPVNTHFVSVALLKPGTTYFFKIISDGTTYDNSGIPWQALTLAGPATPTSTFLVSGNVLTSASQPADDAIVYITGPAISPVSIKTTTSGSYVLTVENATENQALQLFVQGASLGISSAQFLAGSANPLPAIVLGQTYDFRTQTSGQDTGVPQANINLPSESTPSSGFNVPISTTSGDPKTSVTLESVDEKETVNTTTPEFFGEGPAGTTITIVVNSEEEITSTTKVDSSGNWNWTPPSGLSPGQHTITLSWKDASGILRTLTRSFVVSAAEGPAFEATPSASPFLTLPTASATPSASPRVSLPSTSSGIPVSGIATPTLIGIFAGIILIVGAIVLAL